MYKTCDLLQDMSPLTRVLSGSAGVAAVAAAGATTKRSSVSRSTEITNGEEQGKSTCHNGDSALGSHDTVCGDASASDRTNKEQSTRDAKDQSKLYVIPVVTPQ